MTFRPAECPIFGAVARPYGPLCGPTTMNPGHRPRSARIESRISNLELTVAGMRRDLAHMYGEIIEQHAHTDQLVARIERIERRLELQDG